MKTVLAEIQSLERRAKKSPSYEEMVKIHRKAGDAINEFCNALDDIEESDGFGRKIEFDDLMRRSKRLRLEWDEIRHDLNVALRKEFRE
jgi:hypothetical protein